MAALQSCASFKIPRWLRIDSLDKIEETLPSKTDCSRVFWISADAPKSHPEVLNADGSSSEEAFLEEGQKLIDDYFENVIQKKGMATPKDKKTFVEDIYKLATRHNQVVGKWLIFPRNSTEVDEKWRVIAKETIQGNLGHSAKVNPLSPGATCVICIYCSDFNDKDTCEKVLRRLEKIGFKISSPFKADAVTKLGLTTAEYRRLQISGCWGLHYDLIGKSPKW